MFNENMHFDDTNDLAYERYLEGFYWCTNV